MIHITHYPCISCSKSALSLRTTSGFKMEIYNAKSLDTFSSEVSTKWKRSKKMEALLSEQALCM